MDFVKRLVFWLCVFLLPLSVMADAAIPEVFKHAPEDLVWSFSTLFGGLLGLMLHVTMSWGEWRKVTGDKCSLFAYIYEDMPGFMTAWILSTASYFALPLIGQIGAVQNFFGFAPGMNFLSSFAVTYIGSSLGYKLRAYFIRKAG